MLTRRWPAAVLAAVFVAAMWILMLAGPVLAHADGNPVVARAATPKVAPDGSPFYVQAIMAVALLILGVAYFRLMSHSGRRTPMTKAEQAESAAADEKQPSDA